MNIDDSFLMETRNDLEQNVGTRFFNFIIFLSIIMLEKMTFLVKYQRLQLSIEKLRNIF